MPEEAKQVVADKAVAPAPAAVTPVADKKTEGTASPSQSPAPAESKRGNTESVEKADSKVSDKADAPKPDKAKFEFIKMRKELKEAKAKVVPEDFLSKFEKLERELAELKTQKAEPKGSDDDVSSFLENPTKFLEERDNKVVERVLGAIEQSKREEYLAKAAADAESWLLTRSNISDPEFAADIQKNLERFSHIAQSGDMMGAATLAYIEACRMRNVNPDLGIGKQNIAPMGSSGVRPSVPDSIGGPKQWSGADARKYIESVRPDNPEYKARIAEIEKAYREGRVK
jgi:hypothetical protein